MILNYIRKRYKYDSGNNFILLPKSVLLNIKHSRDVIKIIPKAELEKITQQIVQPPYLSSF